MSECAQAQKPRIFNATPITTTGAIDDDTLYLNESTTFEPTTAPTNSVNNLNEDKCDIVAKYEVEHANKVVCEREESCFYQTNSKSNEETTDETNLYCLDDDYYEIPGLPPLDDEAGTINNNIYSNNNETETLSNVHSNDYGQEFTNNNNNNNNNDENDDEDDTGNISTSVNNNFSELNNTTNANSHHNNNTLATNTDESSEWSQPEGKLKLEN